MKKAKPYRNWLVWWLQQKRKERNGSVGAWYSSIAGILGFYDGTKYTDIDLDNDGTDDTGLLSSVGSSNAPVLKSQSHAYDGSAYIRKSATGPDIYKIEFSFYNNVELNNASTNQAVITTDSVEGVNGFRFGLCTGLLTDEIITLASGGIGRAGYTSASESIGVGKHDVVCEFVSNEWQIWLDGVRVDNQHNATEEPLTFDTVAIGSSVADTTKLLDTNLWNLKAYDSTGNVILDCPGTNAVGTKIPMQINGLPAFGTLTGATLPDFYAEHQDGLSGYNPNELGYSARENLVKYSEDFSNAVWGLENCTIIAGKTDPQGGTTAVQVTATGVDGLLRQSLGTLTTDNTYRFKLWVRRVSGSGQVQIYRAGGFTRTTIVPTSEWQEFAAEDGIALGVADTVGLRIVESGDVVEIAFASLQSADTEPDGIYVKTTDTPIQGIQPADPADNGLDILGNTLQYPKPKLSSKYTGYTGAWDGAAYGVLDETVTLSGDFKVEALWDYDTSVSANQTLIGQSGSNNNHIRMTTAGAGYFVLKINGAETLFDVPIENNTLHDVKVERVGTTATLTLDGTEYTLSCDSGDMVLKELCSYFGSTINTGTVPYIKIYNADDTLIHHWVVESDPLSLQDKVYDVVGNNTATLTSATLPFFTTESEEATYLMLNGWTEGEFASGATERLSTITPGSNLTEDSNTLTCTSAGTTNDNRATLSTGGGLSGDKVRLFFTCTVAGTFFIYDNGSYVESTLSPGDYQIDVTLTSTVLYVKLTTENAAILLTSLKMFPTGYIPAKEGEVEWTPDGVELVTNGDFSAWTGDDPDNWTVSNEDANNYITEHADGARIVSDLSTNVYMVQGSIMTVGETYEITITKSGHVSGKIRWTNPFTSAVELLDNTDADGSFVYNGVAALSSITIYRDNTTLTNTDYVLESVSVQETDSSLASASGSALGQPLTANPNDLRSFEPGYIEMPQDKRLINADVVSQYGADVAPNKSATYWTPYGNNTVVDDTDGSTLISYVDNGTGAYLTFRQETTGADLVVGTTYKVTAQVKMNTGSGQVRVMDGTGGIWDTDVTSTTYVDFEQSFVCTDVDSASILSRNLSGTEAINIKDLLVQPLQEPINYFFEPDGDPRQIEYEDLLPTYGAELWGTASETLGTGWTDNGDGTYTCDGTQTGTTSITSAVLPNPSYGKSYQLVTTLTNVTAGNVGINVGGYTGGLDAKITNGSWVTISEVVNTSSNQTIYINANLDFIGTLEFSIKEITATGANVNDQYFFSDYGLAICDAPQDEEAIEAIEHQLGL